MKITKMSTIIKIKGVLKTQVFRKIMKIALCKSKILRNIQEII